MLFISFTYCINLRLILSNTTTEMSETPMLQRSGSVCPPMLQRSDSVCPPMLERSGSVCPPMLQRSDSVCRPMLQRSDSVCPPKLIRTDYGEMGPSLSMHDRVNSPTLSLVNPDNIPPGLPCPSLFDETRTNGTCDELDAFKKNQPTSTVFIPTNGNTQIGHYISNHIYDDNSVYFGNWINGKRDGLGKMIEMDGTTYYGWWEDDVRSGIGQATFKDGTIYDGNWKSNKKHGKGVMICIDGTRYEGEWVDDHYIPPN